MFLISCKTVAVLPTNRPLKNVNLESLVSKIKSNYPRVDKVRSRIKATYDNGKREQQVIVQLRTATVLQEIRNSIEENKIKPLLKYFFIDYCKCE